VENLGRYLLVKKAYTDVYMKGVKTLTQSKLSPWMQRRIGEVLKGTPMSQVLEDIKNLVAVLTKHPRVGMAFKKIIEKYPVLQKAHTAFEKKRPSDIKKIFADMSKQDIRDMTGQFYKDLAKAQKKAWFGKEVYADVIKRTRDIHRKVNKFVTFTGQKALNLEKWKKRLFTGALIGGTGAAAGVAGYKYYKRKKNQEQAAAAV